MVHIPATRVHKEMVREPASIWFVPAQGTDEHAILLKAPTNVLKAIVQGCRVEFVFGIHVESSQRVLCVAVKAHDDLVAPFIVSGAQLHPEEHRALHEILSRERTPLFFFDELNRCICWTEATLDKTDADAVTRLVGSPAALRTGPFDNEASNALDSFDLSLDPNRTDEFPESRPITILPINVVLGEVHYIQIAAVGSNEVSNFVLDDRDEGDTLEHSVWHMLEGLFESDAHKSPQIEIGTRKRELTDMFCFSEVGLFLFEAKAMSIYATEPLRDTERRTRSVQKQVKKALGQLRGAIRSIREGGRVSTSAGVELHFDRNLVPHVIVLVSELVPFGNWDDIVLQVMAFARNSRALVHVLDLNELGTLRRLSKDKYVFDHLLIQRFEHFMREQTVLIRVQPSNESAEPST